MALLRRRGEAADGENDQASRQAPVGRTVAFMVMGLVVAFWGFASLLAS
jgi:type VI protein secretion system component VasF